MPFLKNCFALGFALLVAFPLIAQNYPGPFSLSGKFKGADGDIIYLNYAGKDGKQVKDSCIVKNGAYSFKGELSETSFSYLFLKSKGIGKRVELFLESSEMQADLDTNDIPSAKLSGSVTQQESMELKKSMEGIQKEMEPLSAKYEAANSAYIDSRRKNLSEKIQDSLKKITDAIHDEFDPFQDRFAAASYQFFRANPTSLVTAYQLRYHVSKLQADSLKKYYDKLGSKTQQTSYGKLILDELTKLSSGSPGSMAKNFITTDITNKPLKLSDFKGKYVLLDFWASWCGPCRKGNPHLKELYSQYKNKGFEVIGVSDDDQDHAAWKKAVSMDGLPWIHVLRGLKYDTVKGFDRSSDISDLYGIHSLPTQILIDPNGKIIARYGGGGEEHEGLDARLQSVFK